MISREEVKKMAELSLLAVEEEELDKLTGEIDAILGYVSEIDTIASVQTLREKPELYNVMRDDEVTNEENEYTARIMAEVPNHDGTFVKVKKIL